jgi:hypothetical protein
LSQSRRHKYNASVIEAQSSRHDLEVALRTTLVLLLLLHFGVVGACLRALDTMDVSIYGFVFLRSDMGVGSFDYNEFGTAQLLAVLGLLVWGIGIPVLGAGIMCQNRHRLHLPAVASLYGGLYEGMRVPSLESLNLPQRASDNAITGALLAQPNFWYWELLVAVPRKLLLAIAVVAVRSPLLQSAIIIGVLTISLVVQVAAKPYVTSSLNVIETFSLAVLWLSAFSGLVLGDGNLLASSTIVAVQAATSAANVLFLLGAVLLVARVVVTETSAARSAARAWLYSHDSAAKEAGGSFEEHSAAAVVCAAWPCVFGCRRGALAWVMSTGAISTTTAEQLLWLGRGGNAELEQRL